MTRLLALTLIVCSTTALAQEIGKEIPADQQTQTPPADQTPNYDNPYATPPPPPPNQAKKDEAAADTSGNVPGPRKMAFGFRAGFGGSSIPAVTSGIGAVAASAPTLGLKLFATESVALNIDLGLMTNFANTMSVGFGFGFGIDAYFGSKDKPVRPFATGGASIGRGTAPLDRDGGLSLAFNVGGGGAYWFSDYFAVDARALIGIPVAVSSAGSSVTVATFMPGIGGTVFF